MAYANICPAEKRVQCSVDGCTRPARSRGWCSGHYMKWYSFGDPNRVRPIRAQSVCTVDGCDRPSRTRSGSLCEVHYYRRYRRGTFDGPTYKRRYLATTGYITLSGVPAHPMVTPSGLLYEHRKVLFDRIGYGDHACFWCASPVSWRGKGKQRLVVDHLDSDKTNNADANLEPSCNSCNANRGLFMAWVMKHKDDPFLARLFSETKANQCDVISLTL